MVTDTVIFKRFSFLFQYPKPVPGTHAMQCTGFYRSFSTDGPQGPGGITYFTA